MNKIPTAQEMFEANPILPEGVTRGACIAFMKAFAKLHVQAALDAAANKSRLTSGTYYPMIGYRANQQVDKKSILNAYPLDNIK